MEVRAVTKHVRISPEKARHIARLLPGKKATDALGMVDLISRKAARLMAKTLRSAIANAENNFDLDKESLVVVKATVGAGRTLKRWKTKARGSAGRILKRSSHFEIVLSNDNLVKGKKRGTKG